MGKIWATPQRDISSHITGPSVRSSVILSLRRPVPYHFRINVPTARPNRKKYWKKVSSMGKPRSVPIEPPGIAFIIK